MRRDPNSCAANLVACFNNARAVAYRKWLNAEKSADKKFWREVLTIVEKSA